MALYLSETSLYSKLLSDLPAGKLLITTLNAYSYNVAQRDEAFAEALMKSDVLLPDGISVVLAAKWLTSKALKQELRMKLKKIAGEDLFYWEMERLQKQAASSKQQAAKVFFLGSTEVVLSEIQKRAGVEFPNIEVHTYSPPYKEEFTDEDNTAMMAAISAVQPDVLFVGMTAPKQEKWAYKLVNSLQLIVDSERMKDELHSSANKSNVKHVDSIPTTNYQLPTNLHICCIGAVFDFYAGTVQRAPGWMINIGMEWFYRLLMEPRRMWKRYLLGNLEFVIRVIKEAVSSKR